MKDIVIELEEDNDLKIGDTLKVIKKATTKTETEKKKEINITLTLKKES